MNKKKNEAARRVRKNDGSRTYMIAKAERARRGPLMRNGEAFEKVPTMPWARETPTRVHGSLLYVRGFGYPLKKLNLG